MTDKKTASPTSTHHIVGDSLFPPFAVKSPMPTSTATPSTKSGTSPATANGNTKANEKG